ncbi:hypothetical protein ALT761_00895 [Alteromonas sp. 76-1]|nr:hypothetical protein ALT761_00895 [Alteromonas sp. 76-1]
MDTNLVHMSHFRRTPISEALIVGGMGRGGTRFCLIC